MEEQVRRFANKIAGYKRKRTNSTTFKNILFREFGIKRFTGGRRNELFWLFKKYNLKVIDSLSQKEQDIREIDVNANVYVLLDEHVNEQRQKKNIRYNSPVEQKNALQRLLQKKGYIIETEKRFPWLKTPNKDSIPSEYQKIIKVLENYRGNKNFFKYNYSLLCDFVIEKEKIIIEYDERQHFSEARRLSLLNYPTDLVFHFPIDKWIKYCEEIQAKDNNPADRDEARAFYDSVRDIQAAKNGYKLIRIKHGETDWTSTEAEQKLEELLKYSYKFFGHKHLVKKSENIDNEFKIARLVISDYSKFWKSFDYSEVRPEILKKIKEKLKNKKVEYLITPGGFLILPMEDFYPSFFENEDQLFSYFTGIAAMFINTLMDTDFYSVLYDSVKYFSVGVDFSFEEGVRKPHIELVLLYDVRGRELVNSTGKFYPTADQSSTLIKVKDFDTKFLNINGEKILVLGCHDLNVFNPRGQSNLAEGTYKSEISREFYKRFETERPEVILHHPHSTDSPRIWLNAWQKIAKYYPFVKHYASGIFYDKHNARGKLEQVLNSTQKGKVLNIIL